MVTQVSLIARSANGKVQTYQYKPGAKHSAQQNTIYKLVVDGSEQIPPGTKIFRKGDSIVVQFADGQVFEIGDWCSVADSRLIDLDQVQALRASDGAFVVTNEIGSGACLIGDNSGDSAGSLGDLASQTAWATATPAAAEGGSMGYLLGGLAVLGLAGAAGGGGGGGGSGGGGKPATPAGALAVASDSGIQGDNVTSDATPTITGKGQAGQTVELRDATTNALIGSAVVDSNGDWTLTPATPLPEGTNNFNLIATGAGGASDPVAFSLVIDSTPPPAPSGQLSIGSDSGTTSDSVTNDATPTISGTGTPGDSVEVRDAGGKAIGSATVDANGDWSITPSSPLPEGVNNLQLITTDVSGNVSAPAPFVLTIDSTPSPAPTAAMDPASDSTTAGDGLTNDTTPTVSAGGANPGDTITVTFPGGEVITTTVAGDGTWSVTPTTALADGLNYISVTATDPAGNTSAPTTFTLNVDGTASAPPAALLAPTSDSGIAGDIVTNDATPTVSGGGANPGDTITVTFPGGEVLTGTVAGDGSWSVTPINALPDGLNNVSVTATDPAGNVSTATTLALNIDSTPPPAPPSVLDAGSDGGTAGDGLTNDTTPTVSGGGANPGDTITVTFPGGEVLTTTVAGDGTWSVTPIVALAEGVNNVSVTSTDAAGNVGPAATVAVTIDSTAPSAPAIAPDLTTATDTGNSSSDDLTANSAPVFAVPAGTGTAGDVVTLYVDGITAGRTTVQADGSFTVSPTGAIGDGARNITYTFSDAAGNESLPSPLLAITVDTTAPVALAAPDLAAATDTGSNNSDDVTGDSTPSFTGAGAEPNAVISVFDGATLLGTTTADASGNWTFTVTTALADGSHSISATQTDGAGNVSATSPSLAISVVTVAPSAPLATLAPASDSGVAGDSLTNDTTPTISGGGANSGDTIIVSFPGGEVLTATVAGDGTWSVTPTTALTDGLNNVSVTAIDAAGNVSAPTIVPVTIDTTAPAAPVAVLDPASDSGTAGDNITSDTTPTISGSGANPGDTITVTFPGGEVLTATVAGDGTWSVTPTTALTDGLNNVSVTATDAADNVSAATTVPVTIDTAAPAAPAAVLDPVSDSGTAGDNITSDTTPTISGSGANPGDTITVTFPGGEILTATVAGDGTWSVTPTTALADGLNNITVTATDAAGNVSAATTVPITMDSTAPSTLTAPDLTAATDSGASDSDDITGDNTPSFTGAGTEPGATITLYDTDGVTALGTASADGSGNWNITASTLSDGVHNLTVTQTDAAGNTSAASPALAVTVDTAAATPAAPDLTAATDSGASNSDNNTNDNTPTFSGSGAEPGATISLYDTDGVTVLGATTADASGNWSITASAMADGDHDLTVKQTDLAGNTSLASPALTVTIDTTPPAALTVPDMTAATDLGASNGDDITNDATPEFTGAGAAPNATVTLYDSDGVTVLGSTSADALGNWSITPASAMSEGPHTLTAKQVDTAGNESPASPGLSVTIDTAVPNAPAITSVTENSGGGINLVESSDGTPVLVSLSGTGAETGDSLILNWGGQQVIQVLSATDVLSGSLTVTVPQLTIAAQGDGTFDVTAQVRDPAGNTGPASAPSSVTVDTVPPGAPGAPVIPEAAPDINGAEASNGTPVTVDLTGTGAIAGDTLIIDWGGQQVIYTLLAADVSGNSATVTIPAAMITTAAENVPFNVSASLIDQVGNAGPSSGPASVTVDTTPPPSPQALDLAGVDDSGSSNSDNITSQQSNLTISGNAIVGDTVRIYRDVNGDGLIDGGDQLLANAVPVDGAGNFSADITLTEGVHNLLVAQVDISNNESAPGLMVVTVDATAPNAPTPSVAENAGGGINALEASDGTIVDISLAATGAVVGDTLTLTWGGQPAISHLLSAADIAAGTVAFAISAGAIAAEGDGVINVSATIQDQAGNTSSPGAISITVDAIAPPAPIALDLAAPDDTGSSNTDNLTRNTTGLTITGNGEDGSTVTLFDDIDSDGVIDAGETLGSGIVAAGAFAIDVSLAVGVHNVTAIQADAVGNIGAISAPLIVTVDTTIPATLTAPDLTAATDSGASSTDNNTSDNTPTFTGAGAAPNAVVTLYDSDGTTVIGGATADALGNWTITASTLSDGVHNVSVTQTDNVGNESAHSPVLAVTIDTTAPAALSAPDLTTATDSGVSGTDNNTGDNTPNFTGTGAEPGATITLFDTDGATVLGSALADVFGNWSITAGSMSDGVHNVTATQTDAAGNSSPASAPLAVTIDTTAPAALSAPDLVAPSDGGISATDNLTNDTTPTFTGSGAQAGATVTLYDSDGTTVLGTTTADGAGNWTITAVAIAAGLHAVTVKQTDAAGNTSAASPALSVTIDNVAPAALTAPDLTAATDTGNSTTDNITNDNTSDFSGTGAEPNATVTLYDSNGTTVLGSTTADGLGNWTITASSMTDGVHNVTVKQTDAAGNISIASPALAVTIDTTAPSIPAPDMTAGTDLGSSNSDNVTSDNTPTFTLPAGTAQPGDTVELLINGSVVAASITINPDGSLSATPTGAIADGTSIPVAFRITDAAGNVGTSANLNIEIDTSAPAAPAALDLLATSDSGASSVDNFTNDTTPTISGAPVTAGALVKLYDSDGTTLLGTAVADGSGNWSITPSLALSSGLHNFTATQTDAAGNQSPASTALAVTIDTVAPVNVVPATASGPEDTQFSIAGISVTDTGNHVSSVQLSVANGTLNVVAGATTLTGSGSDSLTIDGTQAAINAALSTLSYQGNSNFNGSDSLTIITIDSAGQSDTDSISITVNPVNDAPTLDLSKAPAVSTPQYVFSSGGDVSVHAPTGASPSGSVAAGSLVDFVSPLGQVDNVTDPDAGAALGIGITSLSESLGSTLWYTTNAGTTWNWTSNTSDSGGGKGLFGADGIAGTVDDRVLLLRNTDKLIFDGGTSGTSAVLSDAITMRAWDQISGTTGNFVTNPATGGSNSLSSDTDTVSANFTNTTIDLSRLNPSAGVRIGGGTANAKLGWDVSAAGDVNGDGFEDFLVAENGVATTGKGKAYLVLGQAGDFGAVGSDGMRSVNVSSATALTFTRTNAGESMESVSGLGDINNDGYADFIVAGKGGTGSAYVFFGGTGITAQASLDTITASKMFKITGVGGIGNNPGTTSWLNDVNGDGFNDLIVGARLADPKLSGAATTDAGMAFVVYGHAGTAFGTSNTLNFSSFQSVDLVLNSNDTAGTAGHVLDAGTNTRGLVIGGGVAGGQAGHTVSGVGDLNGDGYSEFGLSRVSVSANGTVIGFGNLLQQHAGNLMTFDATSSPGNIESAIGVSAASTSYERWLAQVPSTVTAAPVEPNRVWSRSVGDVNGDGLDDVAIAYNSATSSKGEVYVLFGSTTVNRTGTTDALASGANGFKLVGAAATDFFGNSVRSVGDINGDGYDDFVIGAPQNEVGTATDQGAAYVIYGGSGMAGTTVDLSTGLASNRGLVIRGNITGDQGGFAVGGAGDVNGDGLDDLLIGAPLNDQVAADAGAVYLIYGNEAYGNPLAQKGTNLIGTAAADSLVGTGGTDTLSSGGGVDALSGGAGNDLLVIADANFRRVDGGTGVDTLQIAGTGITLDFNAATGLSGKVRDIEIIDLTGSGNNTLKVNLQDVLNMSATSNTLRIDGDVGDMIQIDDLTAAWTDSGRVNADGTVNATGLYHKFNQGAASLIIDEDITRVTF